MNYLNLFVSQLNSMKERKNENNWQLFEAKWVKMLKKVRRRKKNFKKSKETKRVTYDTLAGERAREKISKREY